MMSQDVNKRITFLEERANVLRSFLGYARRPFVIEFAGTPKSGKTTYVQSIKNFFRRNGFQVKVLQERADFCPIPMKGHLFFNTWATSTMLAEMLENIESEVNIIIKDRGLFDSLVWLLLQMDRGELNEDEYETIEKYILLPRWRELVDAVVLTVVNPDEAIKREQRPLITTKLGSIMNKEVLGSISNAAHIAASKYENDFSCIILKETTDSTPKETSLEIGEEIIDELEKFLNPKIMVVPRSSLEDIKLENGGCFDSSETNNIMVSINANKQFIYRDKAEKDSDMVQIIPCGVLVNDERIFTFLRKEKDPKSNIHGKRTIWRGCHVTKSEEESLDDILKNALLKRISEDLFISRKFPLNILGYTWEKDNPKENKHLAIVYSVNINSPEVAKDLQGKEFRKGKGFGFDGKFHSQEMLVEQQEELDLESWSKSILRNNVRI